jgi:SAM-dependent methyltransferase
MSTVPKSLDQNRRVALWQPAESRTPAFLAGTFQNFLDDIHDGLCRSGADQGVVDRRLDDLFEGLQAFRRSAGDDWKSLVAACRTHALNEIIQQDPFTHRAYSKPRGYAGDAEMLDYIYGREEQWPEPEASPLGLAVFRYTTQAPASAGVRARRGFIADLLDRLVEEVREPEVLSIAAGHLREASLAAAVKRRRVGRLVALDADPVSLKEVERRYGAYRVEAVAADMRKLLAGRLSLGQFDLVYSTGLFDYLNEAIGRRLVTSMFRMLKPGGRLVVANFMPEVRDIGYMEAYMDWNLIYRTRYDMVRLTQDVPQGDIKDLRLFAEENQNIIFLELTRT